LIIDIIDRKVIPSGLVAIIMQKIAVIGVMSKAESLVIIDGLVGVIVGLVAWLHLLRFGGQKIVLVGCF
jgi:hypothetical protein